MTKETYKKALEAAQKELAQATQLQKETQRRIMKLRQTIFSLTMLLTKEAADHIVKSVEEIGLTDAIREILRIGEKPLSPIEVRKALEELGYDLSKYTNPLASIHTILKRLVKKGQATIVGRGREKRYAWISGEPVLRRGES